METGTLKELNVVRETVTLHNDPNGGWSFYEDSGTYRRSHRITFKTVDGKPDCSTIKMEEIKE